MVDYAIVKIWDTVVGAVIWDNKKSLASFQYDKKFLEKQWDLSPLKMPLRSGDRVYSFPELLPSKDSYEDTFKGLPGLLADSLPDKYGNLLIDKWLAQNGRAPRSMNPVEKLCFIGTRGMGALEFEPSQWRASKNTFSVEIQSLVEIAQKMLTSRESFETSLSIDENQAMQQILKIGASAGGARPKAIIAFNERTRELRSGQTKVPNGFSHWLLKLDGVSGEQFGESSGWGRIEYAYHLMAKECGIEMTECDLLEENGRAHFMTKRFDREDSNTKHHIQTLCGINHFDYGNLHAYGYEQVFQTMRMLRLPYPQAEQMFRRMVFNVFATNCDDHTKNFSFRLKKDGVWELAPAYDICYAYDPNNIWVKQQTLSVNGKHSEIKKSDLMSVANENNIKKGDQIIDTINKIVENWSDFAIKAKVSDTNYKIIKSNLHTL
jgi:serine/threonine-protein kinase HipA